MYPEEGKAGKFKMLMYRGVTKESERLHDEFASDPGDYGRGEYWTDNKEIAAVYGEVISKVIELDNVYRIPKDEVLPLIEEYDTCKIHLGRENRLEGSLRLTKMFKSKGYDAVLTVGYEDFTSIGLCIFDA
jgi:hypothetical protein